MKHLAMSAAITPLALVMCGSPLMAQDIDDQDDTEIASSENKETTTEVIVTGQIRFRDRTTDVNPTLVYKQDYFQRFEPISVGEMLKRVPGVTFTSDMLEYDGVSMRGLPPGYTKILINGRRAPGGEKDRSFFVDRIPAELVDRIEIIRSPSADQSSEGMAGSINVILKEGAQIQGGLAKVGALINGEDGEVRPSAAIAYAGGKDNTTWWVGANYQGRRNPKQKMSWRYDDLGGELQNTEAQADTRDGTDISLNGELTHKFEGGFVRVAGFAVDTDRDEDEVSVTYDEGVDFDGVETQAERIKQNTYTLKGDGEFQVGPGKVQYGLGWNQYKEDTKTSVFKADEIDLSDEVLDEYTTLNIKDTEFSGDLAYIYKTDKFRLKAGIDLLNKTRDGAEVEWDIDDDGILEEPDPAPGAIYSIEENRIDPYVRLTFEPTDKLTIDAGLRYEMTSREVTSDGGTDSNDSNDLNPSLHFSYRATPADQFRLSFARTTRRADYDYLAPYTAEEEPTDGDDLRGNPNLKNEHANGIDAGYERRLGKQGIFGINLFYRNIEDVIEVIGTGEVSSSGDGQVFEPRNIGEGKTWGAELDFSSPLTALGLPDTGLFFNYTWMDSEVTDPYTGVDRAFANQPSYVYNVGFIQTLKAWNSSFGASLYSRDKGYEYSLDEIASVDYDPSLEAFFEKRLGKRMVLRFSAHNLLNAAKKETFFKYDGDTVAEILENRANGDVDEYEVESEKSGVLYQVTLRATF